MKADKAHITRSIKIARGQLDGILRMIEEDPLLCGHFQSAVGNSGSFETSESRDFAGPYPWLCPRGTAYGRAQPKTGGSSPTVGKAGYIIINNGPIKSE